MRKLLVLVALATVLITGGVALADDPGNHISAAQELLAQANIELDAAKAVPRPTVTETVTATVTETVTATVTATVTQTVTETVTPTSTPPPPACTGVQVVAGANLATVAANNPAGTTFCLAAGTYTVTAQIGAQNGDVFQGAGRAATTLLGTTDGPGIFRGDQGSSTAVYTITKLTIDGPQATASSTTCAPNCGVAITGGRPQLIDMRCTGSGTACVAVGANNVVMDNVECDNNGFHVDSLRNDFLSSACVKLNTGSLTVTNSFIHDNTWVGLWCDFCDNTVFSVTDSTLTHNGARAVQWEVSGNFVAGDRAYVANNIIQDNGWWVATPDRGLEGGLSGIVVSDARNITIENNTFGNNRNGLGGFWAVRLIDGTRDPAPNANIIVRNNTLNGDVACAGTLTGATCTGNV